MKKNKMIALSLIGLMLICTNSICADSKSTEVKYQVEEAYEWSIHPEINFGKNAGSNTSVQSSGNLIKVTKNVVTEDHKLRITVSGSGKDNVFSISNGKSEILNYTVNNGSKDLNPGDSVIELDAGTNDGIASLSFTLNTTKKAAEVAGNYSGQVTYTASIVNK